MKPSISVYSQYQVFVSLEIYHNYISGVTILLIEFSITGNRDYDRLVQFMILYFHVSILV